MDSFTLPPFPILFASRYPLVGFGLSDSGIAKLPTEIVKLGSVPLHRIDARRTEMAPDRHSKSGKSNQGGRQLQRLRYRQRNASI